MKNPTVGVKQKYDQTQLFTKRLYNKRNRKATENSV